MVNSSMNTIYALIESQSGTKFYIGQTYRDPAVRLSEHRYGAKTCNELSEDKYKYAAALDALGIAWEMVILATIEAEKDAYSQDDTEDFYICKYRKEPLQNMRAGWDEPWMQTSYLDIESMLKAKQRHLDRAKFKQPKVKRESDVDKILFSFEKPTKFTAPAFERLAKKHRK